jgi:hypothetical protein
MFEIKPFDPTIDEEEVQRLFRKLGDTRLPEQPIVPDAGWDYGKQKPHRHQVSRYSIRAQAQ